MGPVYFCLDNAQGLDLRVDHTHCFSHHGEGGHYHYDTTPKGVEYVGYFSIAEKIYRVDAPKVTHQVGLSSFNSTLGILSRAGRDCLTPSGSRPQVGRD